MLKDSSNTAKEAARDHMSAFSIFKGLIVSYIVTIPAFMLFALILANTDFPDKFKGIAVVITTIISILAAGITATKGSKSRGWLNGSIIGLVYMLILYILSSIIYSNFSVDRYVITMAIIGILTGAIGGIAGINLKGSQRVRHSQ